MPHRKIHEPGKAIGDDVDEEVQRPVEKREEPHHAAELITAFQPVMRLSGVTASVMHRNRSVQSPVSVRDFLERIGGQIARVRPPRHETERHERGEKHAGLSTHRDGLV